MRFWPTKQFWKWLALGAASVLVVLFIAIVSVAWWVDRSLQVRITAIRAAGDPASIADLAPQPISADNNAAAILQQLGPRLNEFAKDHVRLLDRTPLGTDYNRRRNHGEAPTSDEIEAIRGIVNKYPDLVTGLTRAAACEQYASTADFTLGSQEFIANNLKSPIAIRTAMRFSGWRNEVFLADAQQQQAAELGLQSLRIARLHDAEPLLINYLVGIALRSIAVEGLYDALSFGPVSPQLHLAIESELAQHDDPQRLARVLKTERAFSIDTLIPILDEAPPPIRYLVGWPLKLNYIDMLEMYDELLTEENGSQNSGGRGVLAESLEPSLRAAYDAESRNLAKLRSLRIFNALTAYRDEHGHEATGLADLSVPNEATMDPFSGEPLKLKPTDDGWVIYSVMQDGIDDGGDFEDQKDYGLAPRKWRATE